MGIVVLIICVILVMPFVIIGGGFDAAADNKEAFDWIDDMEDLDAILDDDDDEE